MAKNEKIIIEFTIDEYYCLRRILSMFKTLYRVLSKKKTISDVLQSELVMTFKISDVEKIGRGIGAR